MSEALDCHQQNDHPVVQHAGWDYCTDQPGATAEMCCRVCGAKMEVQRNVTVATGWAHAMAMHNGLMAGCPRDVFSCRFSGAAWHHQALALKQAAAKTPSQRLAKLMLDEAEQVIPHKGTHGERSVGP